MPYRFAMSLGLVVVPAVIAAQQPADTASLPDIFVSETGIPTHADGLTSAYTVLDGAELRARGIRLVADALAEVPGFFVVQPGSFGAVSSLFARGGESDYVKVLVDGVPVNQPGGAFDFATLTTDNVERIEIVRGPASVAYGSDAVTGVVRIVTRSGRGPLAGAVTASGGTFGSSTLSGSAGGGGSRLGWSVAGSRFATDGIYRFNSGFDNAVLSGRVDFHAASATDAALTARYDHNTFHFPTDGAGVPSDSNQFSHGHTLTLGAAGGRRLTDRLEARLSLAANEFGNDYDDRPDGPADTTGFAYASTRAARSSRRSGDLRFNLRPDAWTALSVGSSYEWTHERQASVTTSNFGQGSTTDAAPPFDRSRHVWAGYAQAVADLPHGLALTGGARVDDDQAFGTFVTWRLGAAWRARWGTRFRGSAGNAFKAPTFSQNFADSPFEVGNPALRPERSRSWEVGVEQPLWRGRVTVGATWFDQRFRDLIQYVSAAPGQPTYQNLGAATSRGLKATASAALATGISITAEYTHLLTSVTDSGAGGSPGFAEGQRLLRRPTDAGRLAATARGGRVVVSTGLDLVGSRDDLDFSTFPERRVTLPGYATADLSAEWVAIRGVSRRPGFTLLARGTNLFDQSYDVVVGFPARGRTLTAGGRVDW